MPMSMWHGTVLMDNQNNVILNSAGVSLPITERPFNSEAKWEVLSSVTWQCFGSELPNLMTVKQQRS